MAVDTKFGYAATPQKAQGSAVDRTYVLATPHFDRHAAYVALSRHRETETVFYARDGFGGRGGAVDPENVPERFVEKLSRGRTKDLAHDYLERSAGAVERPVAGVVLAPPAEKTIEATPPAMPHRTGVNGRHDGNRRGHRTAKGTP